jgi:DNA-binding LacI/PurR family transcriptional regulator
MAHDRRPTSADVAARAGVSRTTVSLVLNNRGASIPEATRQRVLEAARELDYHPDHAARGLARGRSHTLALVVLRSADQVATDAFLPEVLRGLTAASRPAGYRVLVEPIDPGTAPYGELVRSGRAEGLIISGPMLHDGELARLVRDRYPVVIQGELRDLRIPSVDVDNRAGASEAVRHLIDLGHRRIACITNAPLEYAAAATRLGGYWDALADAGLPRDEALTAEGAFDAASGRRAMAEVLGRQRPDAVFAASDVVAVGALGALREAGLRVPDDISLVGFDDIPLAGHIDPPLTTVRVPALEIGRAAGAVMLDRLAGRTVPERTVLPTELVVRTSTARRSGARSPASASDTG